MKLCPSIASGNVMNLQSQCLWLQEQYQHIHIDIEDGNYIDNITFGMKTVEGIFGITTCEKSIHLMVMDPANYAARLGYLKPDIVFVHLDHVRYPSKVISAFQKEGLLVGVALNPGETLERYEYLKGTINDVLIMMCEPDGHGQQYQAGLEGKVKSAVETGWNVWLDGGMTKEQARQAGEMGVSAAVLGRAVFTT